MKPGSTLRRALACALLTLPAALLSPIGATPVAEAAACNRLVFATGPHNVVAGVLQPMTVRARRGNDTYTCSLASGTVTLSANSITARFYGDPDGTQEISTVQLANGLTDGVEHAASFYFKDTKAGSTKVTATGAANDTVNQTQTIVPAPAAALSFTQQPGGGTGGKNWGSDDRPVIAIQDQFGNTLKADSTSTISLQIQNNSNGAALTCGTNPKTVSEGDARFGGCKIDKARTGYVLRATTSAGSFYADSQPFDVAVGPADRLAFFTQPGAGSGGDALPTQPQVEVQDAGGNRVITDTSEVSLRIAAGTVSGAQLGGTVTKNAVSGLATFTDLSIDRAGTGYKLAARHATLPNVQSASFDVSVGPAAGLAFTRQPRPNDDTGGSPFSRQPVVEVQDRGGNALAGNSAATVRLDLLGSTNSATLSCTTNPLTVSSGVASFAGCKIDKAPQDYRLRATTSAGSFAAETNPFTVSIGPAARLIFSALPSRGTATRSLPRQPVVLIQDLGGNTRVNGTADVTLAITSGTGTAGAALLGTTTVAASGGIATFAGLVIDRAGSGYRLTATRGALTAESPASFDVFTPPASLSVSAITPTSSAAPVTAGTPFGVTVQTLDASGQPTYPETDTTVSLGISGGTGTLAGPLVATIPSTTTGVTVSGLTYTRAETVTFTATTSGLSAGAASFVVAPGAVNVSTVAASPTSVVADGVATAVVAVTLVDGNGNPVPNKLVALTSSRGSVDVISPASVATDAGGTATFSIASSSTGIVTLSASNTTDALALPQTTNVIFVAGPPARLALDPITSPQIAGTPFGVAVRATDASGHPSAVSANTLVTLAVGSGAGSLGGTLTGTIPASSTSVFIAGVTYSGAAPSVTLIASAASLGAGTSNPFAVSAAPSTQPAESSDDAPAASSSTNTTPSTPSTPPAVTTVSTSGTSGTSDATITPPASPPAPVPPSPAPPVVVIVPVTSGGAPTQIHLANGLPVNVTVDPRVGDALRSLPGVAGIRIVFQAVPASLTPAETGTFGGSGSGSDSGTGSDRVVTPLAQPIDIRLELVDAAGRSIDPSRLVAGQPVAPVSVTLPVLHQPLPPDSVFAWLQAIYDPAGQFLGYIRPAATFDRATGSLTLLVAVEQFQGTLFLPAVITHRPVRSVNPLARMYSGPTADAVDFGLASPSPTIFTVVAPPVAGRLFVYNPGTDNYGWVREVDVQPASR